MKKRFSTIRLKLLAKSPFLAFISFKLPLVESKTFKTMATNGTEILYNVDFLNSVTDKELLGLYAHELYHVVFYHPLRMGKVKYKKLYNCAADCVINELLFKDDFVLPDSALYDSAYDGMSTEQVYEILVKAEEDSKPIKIKVDHLYADLKHIPTQTEKDLIDVTNTIYQASSYASATTNGVFKIPAEVRKIINKTLYPVLSWRTLLRRYMTAFSSADISFSRPNRRFFPTWYLPSKQAESLTDITIAIDSSGSISKRQLQEILSEIKHLYTSNKPRKLTLISCDYRINSISEIKNIQDITSFSCKGGNGTDFEPVFEYCAESRTNLLIYFTDLQAQPITKETGLGVKTLWICYSTKDKAEYGTTIYYTPPVRR